MSDYSLSSEWVTLKDGTELPLSAIRLALDLHDQGWQLARLGDRLSVTPRDPNATETQQMPDLLRSAITEHKPYLLLVVDSVKALDVVVPDAPDHG